MLNDNLTGKSDTHITWLDNGIGLHTDALASWQELCDAANSDNIHIEIVSGFRPFERQLAIWNAKYTGERPVKDLANNTLALGSLSSPEKIAAIMLYSALPGASRHHWGTDIDVYSPSLLSKDQALQLEPWEYEEQGPFSSLSKWLQENAHQFGFYFPYKEYLGGVAPEPWHLSYFPLADDFTRQLSIDLLYEAPLNEELAGKSDILSTLPSLYNQFIVNINMS